MRVSYSIILVISLAVACKREERGLRVNPPAATTIQKVSLVDLYAGARPAKVKVSNDYEENAYALSEGKNLYSAYNCVGCHAHGGGGMGVPLMDDQWIYGSDPEQIFATIVEGRPNGMPSFRGKIPDHQVWQLAAYVRSLAGFTSKIASPNRDDHMHVGPPENSRQKQTPKDSFVPKSSELPK
jgi:cytochrome c oxidase cbb3-type subunit III